MIECLSTGPEIKSSPNLPHSAAIINRKWSGLGKGAVDVSYIKMNVNTETSFCKKNKKEARDSQEESVMTDWNDAVTS